MPDVFFTDMESKVLPYMTCKEKVATHQLGMHPSTYKYHKLNIIRKLGVTNAYSAIAVLAANGYKFFLEEPPASPETASHDAPNRPRRSPVRIRSEQHR